MAFYLLGCGLHAIPAAHAAPREQARTDSPDDLYRRREDIASARRAAGIWAARSDYESSWKLARVYYWLGTRGPDSDRRDALERGVKAGEQAVRLDPARPEGHFWTAANMGRLAEAHGFLQGLKYRGRIKDALERVVAIDRPWEQGSADRALGLWYFKVPRLFGGSRTKAEEHLRRALTYNAISIATLYYLAEVLAAGKKKEEAKRLLEECVEVPLDPEWAPEDREFKRLAAAKLLDF